MADNLSESSQSRSNSFQQVLDSFLSPAGLPFSKLLSAERIARIFARHKGLFGTHGVYSTAVMVWSFLGQVLRDGKEASCQSAVARVITFCKLTGKTAPTADTRNYCRARAKLSVPALRELSGEQKKGSGLLTEKGGRTLNSFHSHWFLLKLGYA